MAKHDIIRQVKKYKYQFYMLATLALFVFSTTWLAGPNVNRLIERGPNMISEYESSNMPYAQVFTIFDSIAAIVLILISYLRRREIKQKFNKYIPYILYLIGGLEIIDALVPVTCMIKSGICTTIFEPFTLIHLSESFLVAGSIILLAIYVSYKERSKYWLPAGILAFHLFSLSDSDYVKQWIFSAQAMSLLLSAYLLWYTALGDFFDNQKRDLRSKSFAQHTIAGLIILNALWAIIEYVLKISEPHKILSDLPFHENLPWMNHHIILTSLLLIYLARSLWHGSLSAWRIVTMISFLEIVRHAFFAHSYKRALIDMLIFVLLITSKSSFTLKQTFESFRKRLINTLTGIVILSLIISAMSVLFRYYSTHEWERSAFSPTRVVKRAFLLEINTDADDPKSARLLAHGITDAGLMMYFWIFLGLFTPTKVRESDDSGAQLARELLTKYSDSSEDYFKLWPSDKNYWANPNKTAVVAYRQVSEYLLALANPIAGKANYSQILLEFHDYAHEHGAKVAWLMINQSSLKYYQNLSYNTLQIGAGAVIDVQKFSQSTVKNKWWRWKRNKAIKSGLVYDKIEPAHDIATLERLKYISDQWLKNSNHDERGFALGYFSANELSGQIIHSLKDSTGQIVAFANQLPSAKKLDTTTIDLMRFLPECNESMAFLLSEIIINLTETDQYKYFDLGLVPLAKIGKNQITKTTVNRLRNLLKPVYSSKGLEQFKDKFDPNWQNYYIAYEGDNLDIPKLFSEINSATKLN